MNCFIPWVIALTVIVVVLFILFRHESPKMGPPPETEGGREARLKRERGETLKLWESADPEERAKLIEQLLKKQTEQTEGK